MTKYRSKGTLEAMQFKKFGDHPQVRRIEYLDGNILYELDKNGIMSPIKIGDYIISRHGYPDDVVEKAEFEKCFEHLGGRKYRSTFTVEAVRQGDDYIIDGGEFVVDKQVFESKYEIQK